MTFTLPELGYSYEALEPYLDARTIEIHYSKHHQTYVNNANKAMEGLTAFKGLCAGQILAQLDKIPSEKRLAVRNNVGGHANHCLLWKCMKVGTELKGALKDAIIRDFGSIEKLHEALAKTSVSQFGSGWGWLVLSKAGKLFVASTPNQDNPIMGEKYVGFAGYPLLALDVWEHAYYLKYQNRRLEYVDFFWNIINWDYIAERFENATKAHFHL